MDAVNNKVELKKILIIRFSSIGDILLTTPAIRLLKARFPECRIDFVIKRQFSELLAAHPAIDRLYQFNNSQPDGLRKLGREVREQHYDLILDLHNNFRSHYLTMNSRAKFVLRYQKPLLRRLLLVKFKINLFKRALPVYQRYLKPLQRWGIRDDGLGLDIFFKPEIIAKINVKYQSFFQQSSKPVIGIAPGASFATKRWSAHGFKRVADHLLENSNTALVFLGDTADRELIDSLNIKKSDKLVNAAGELSIAETAALVDHCDLVLTNDSGLMHLAEALKKKVVAIFGSTTRELGFFPTSANCVVIEKIDVPCRPCSHIGRQKCPKDHFRCMEEITPQQVIEEIENLLHFR
ncbi:MAG TPA: lipopolysaccharide heptosyltransferase II [bacterium]|nr:lipopolysaccharide heptosyltransferase II [bacterium]